jgi:hypothetical protein
VYTLANKNFREFIRFFRRGFYPFKIRSTFKSHKIVEFTFQIMFRIGSLSNGQSCSLSSYLSVLNFPKNFGGQKDVSLYFLNWAFESVLENHLNSRPGEGPPVSDAWHQLARAYARATQVTACSHPITTTTPTAIPSGLEDVHPPTRVFTPWRSRSHSIHTPRKCTPSHMCAQAE